MAIKNTPKAIKLLEQATDEKGEELTSIEKIINAAPAYIPTAVIGMSTILCIFSTNILNKQKQASLTSAYALIDQSFKNYRGKLIELHGKEADLEVRDALVRECCSYHQIGSDVPDRKLTFFEPISGETIYAYEKEIMDAEYHFNRNFTMRGSATLNEWFEFLGLPQTEYGDTVGWSMESGIMWVDFEHRIVKDGDETCYEICYVFEPDADYDL